MISAMNQKRNLIGNGNVIMFCLMKLVLHGIHSRSTLIDIPVEQQTRLYLLWGPWENVLQQNQLDLNVLKIALRMKVEKNNLEIDQKLQVPNSPLPEISMKFLYCDKCSFLIIKVYNISCIKLKEISFHFNMVSKLNLKFQYA